MKRNIKGFLSWAIPAIIGVLLFTQTDEILGVGHWSLKKRMVDVVQSSHLAESKIPKDIWEHEAMTRSAIHKDPISDELVDLLKTSPRFGELRFIQDLVHDMPKNKKQKLRTKDSEVTKVSKESEEIEEIEVPKDAKNAVQLESWLTDTELNKEGIETIVKSLKTDREKLMEISEKYTTAVANRKYAVILDNEGDDLAYLWMNFEDKNIPRVIITYGGYTELRFQAVKEFVTAICDYHEIPIEERPKVYKGFANPYPPGKERSAYDAEEGYGYIEEGARQQYIKESEELENQLKEDGKWKPDAMDHPEFEAGITALEEMIDGSAYTAIAVLTCPAAVAHVINRNKDRAQKIGVTMSSPWHFSNGEDGLRYEPAFNGQRQVSVMNELLSSKVDFVGVGGGTARTEGMRTIHDAKYGNGDGKPNIYAEKGLENLEKVLSSDIRFLQIIAQAGNNVATPKWRDWDIDFQNLWAYLKVKEPKHDGIDILRDPKSVMKPSLEPSEAPRALKWNRDRLLSLYKLWRVWKNPVQWQAPSADLHAIIMTNKAYVQGITGAVRYGSEEIPPSESGPKLVKFIKPSHGEESVHYSISDMNFYLVINKFQEILDKYAAKLNA
ncbi:hypothetical protein DFH28DRAFT_399199 [Melampsora americana]|nr:hypothetical protein DFH28DRAFT_399199 [Melampsora americana]